MDPLEPIQVDPQTPVSRTREEGQAPQPAITGPSVDPADVALVAAQNLFILGVIDHQTNGAISGAADTTGVNTEPIAVAADPLDSPDLGPAPATGGDGCASGAFALLLTLTLAAGTAMAVMR